MTSLTSILGTTVVSRADAEEQGSVGGVTVDIPARRVLAWQLGKGRKARYVGHDHITGVGTAAVLLDDASHVREPESELEKSTAKGHGTLLGSLVLTEAGDAVGHVTDADIDTDSGALLSVSTETQTLPAETLLGFGSYALVVSRPTV